MKFRTRCAYLAAGETVILSHPPLPLAGVSVGIEKGCQESDSPADGCSHPGARKSPSIWAPCAFCHRPTPFYRRPTPIYRTFTASQRYRTDEADEPSKATQLDHGGLTHSPSRVGHSAELWKKVTPPELRALPEPGGSVRSYWKGLLHPGRRLGPGSRTGSAGCSGPRRTRLPVQPERRALSYNPLNNN